MWGIDLDCTHASDNCTLLVTVTVHKLRPHLAMPHKAVPYGSSIDDTDSRTVDRSVSTASPGCGFSFPLYCCVSSGGPGYGLHFTSDISTAGPSSGLYFTSDS
ncbi:hypothetical protein RRG08_015209 [Elysia crispata]|uniref:Uncharacterized protein n=1 Tax=Elysia crispata TaxID=231223 RepID=A0AAE1A7E2_9GAST|nr:hypothetical protein RRG08_015209 [Elysia crispata]